jgi:hypothetical protein
MYIPAYEAVLTVKYNFLIQCTLLDTTVNYCGLVSIFHEMNTFMNFYTLCMYENISNWKMKITFICLFHSFTTFLLFFDNCNYTCKNCDLSTAEITLFSLLNETVFNIK